MRPNPHSSQSGISVAIFAIILLVLVLFAGLIIGLDGYYSAIQHLDGASESAALTAAQDLCGPKYGADPQVYSIDRKHALDDVADLLSRNMPGTTATTSQTASESDCTAQTVLGASTCSLPLTPGDLNTITYCLDFPADSSSNNGSVTIHALWVSSQPFAGLMGPSTLQVSSSQSAHIRISILALTSLSPSTKVTGSGAFTLTVNGIGFSNGVSTVKWNGSSRTTTYVNSRQLTAAIPGTDLASVGNASVTVANTGGGTSDALTFTISATLNYQDTVLSDPGGTPVAYWRLDDTGGTSATDSTGNSYTGALSGAVVEATPGAIAAPNTSMTFDGSTGQIDVLASGSSSLELANSSFSIEVWIYRTGAGSTTYGSIVRRGGNSANKIYLLTDPSGHLCRWDAFCTDGTYGSAYTVANNRWNYVVYTFSATSDTTGTETMYVNGSPVATRTGSVPATATGQDYLIGGNGNHWFQGSLDEMAVYNYALSSTQVSTHFSRQGVSNHIVLSRSARSATSGDYVTYTATSYLANGLDLGTVTLSTLSVARGTCTSVSGTHACAASATGDHIVTATYGSPTQTATAILTVVSPSIYASSVSGSSPVAYWRLDDVGGTTAIDSASGGLHTGTLNGGITEAAAGAVDDGDASMTFNGSSGYISVPASSGSNLNLASSSFSIETWIYKTGAGSSTYGAIVNRGGGGDQKIYLLTDPNGQLCRWSGFCSAYIVPNNVWTYVVYNFNATSDTNGTEAFYINGNLVAMRTGSVPATATGASYSIGGNGSHWFQGSIDEFAVYSGVLGTSTITAHYAAG